MQFYLDNQKGTIGGKVNHFGFKILQFLDLSNKRVLEIGPGLIEHLDHNTSRPAEYILADIEPDFLEKSEQILRQKYDVSSVRKLQVSREKIPLESSSVDLILTFHQLEHVLGLEDYLKELRRLLLKPNGLLAGAVPTEGGLAWGIGRFLTSRRYVRKNMHFDYDKIICWEHPNFVTRIKEGLDREFNPVKSIKRPFVYLPFDFNLSWSFIYQKMTE